MTNSVLYVVYSIRTQNSKILELILTQIFLNECNMTRGWAKDRICGECVRVKGYLHQNRTIYQSKNFNYGSGKVYTLSHTLLTRNTFFSLINTITALKNVLIYSKFHLYKNQVH